MKITAFAEKIVGAFSRNNTVTAYTSFIKEMNDATIPMFENFVDVLKADAKAGKAVDKFGKDLFQRVGKGGSGKWEDRLLSILKANAEQAGDVEDLITKLVPKDADALALDGRAANLVQYVEVLGFANQYLRPLLISLTEDIAAATGKRFPAGLAKPQIKWLQDNVGAFASAVGTLEAAAPGLAKVIHEIPEFNVAGTDIDAMTATHGAAKMDPLRSSGFFSADWNPILAVRMLFTDRVIKRYEAAKAERQALEYRIQALKDSRDGHENPKLEQAIEYHNGQLKKLNYEIQKIEESVQ